MIESKSKFEINTPEEDKLTDIIVDKKNNIANNLVLFEEEISNGQISYSYSVDPRNTNGDVRNCEFSNAVGVKIYKQK